MPLGRPVSGLKVRELEWKDKVHGGFAFDLTPQSGDQSHAQPSSSVEDEYQQ